MVYTPPVRDSVDFNLTEYTPPDNRSVDFDLTDVISGNVVEIAASGLGEGLGEGDLQLIIPVISRSEFEEFGEIKPQTPISTSQYKEGEEET